MATMNNKLLFSSIIILLISVRVLAWTIDRSINTVFEYGKKAGVIYTAIYKNLEKEKALKADKCGIIRIEPINIEGVKFP